MYNGSSNYKLTQEEQKIRHIEFGNNKNNLIKKWEDMTGQKWPCYTENIVNGNGVVLRKAKQPYDTHHIIEFFFEKRIF